MHFGDRHIQDCLNALVWFANPQEKEQAHITFQGPFDSATKASDARRSLPLERRDWIQILGVDRFLSDRQNTVFLKCESRFVRENWRKAAGFDTPHITIYDGKSREIADRVFEILMRHDFHFSIPAGDVETVESISGQSRFFLSMYLDPKNLEAQTGHSFADIQQRIHEDWFRLMVIDRLCSRLTWLASEVEGLTYSTSRIRAYR